MKLLPGFIILLLFPTLSWTQSTARPEKVNFSALKKYNYNKMWLRNDPYTGLVETFHGQQLTSQTEYKDGWKHGHSIHWYKTGEKRSTGEYFEDKTHGLWRYWNEEGQIIQKGAYHKGKPVGEWLLWYEGEHVVVNENYLDGVRHGMYEKKDENKKLLEKGNYEYGIKVGFWTVWNKQTETYEEVKMEPSADEVDALPTQVGKYDLKAIGGRWFYKNVPYTGFQRTSHANGKPHFEHTYKEGLLVSERGWYDNEQDFMVGNYVHGKKEGKWIYQHRNGNPFMVQHYKAGEKHGPWLEYTESGELKSKAYYKNGLLEGKRILWNYTNGQQKNWEATYSKGEMHGTYKRYHDGKLYQEKGYHEGQLHGSAKEYSTETGQLQWENFYEYGAHTKLIFYHENGNKKSITLYANNKPSGTFNAWFPNKQLAEKGAYLNGKKHGKWKKYFEGDSLYRLETKWDKGAMVHQRLLPQHKEGKMFITDYSNTPDFGRFIIDLKVALREQDSSKINSFFADHIMLWNDGCYSEQTVGCPKATVLQNHAYYRGVNEFYTFLKALLKQGIGQDRLGIMDGYPTDNNTPIYSTINFSSTTLSDLFFDYKLTLLTNPEGKVYARPHPNARAVDQAHPFYYGKIDIGCINDEGSYSGCWYEVSHNGKPCYIKAADVDRGNSWTRLLFGKIKGQWKIIGMQSPPGC